MNPLISVPSTSALIAYAWYRQSLTLQGILAATLTAVAHVLHPWSAFYGLLAVFFLSGTFVTKIKHTTKAVLTTSSTGQPSVGKAPPRTATQVFANSLPASVLILLDAYHLKDRSLNVSAFTQGSTASCLPYPSPQTYSVAASTAMDAFLDTLPYVIVAAYATAAADTFASELGILSRERPVLLPSLLMGKVERVPPGTNGGITGVGVLASALGALIIGVTAALALPLCDGSDVDLEKKVASVQVSSLDHRDPRKKQWDMSSRAAFALVIMIIGTIGALVDSLLGAWCQASVVDSRTGKVVEADGGGKVLHQSDGTKEKQGRRVLVGRDLLSNNGVNFATGVTMCVFTMVGLVFWSGGLGKMTERTI